MAGSGRFEIIVKGKGGHGGRPQLTIDPIVASAQLITQLQTLVSRNISPLESAVISVCSVESGSAYNIIPPLRHDCKEPSDILTQWFTSKFGKE